MVKSTIIARVTDGLPLAASMDDEGDREFAVFKTQAKSLFKKLSDTSDQRCSVESGPFYFHYIIEVGVCYLCICEKSYPKKLAFSYLEELQKEFQESYGADIGTVGRPYAFVKFDTFIQKVKRSYQDPRAQKNLQKLNEEIQDVTRVMTRNIQDLLGRDERLNRMGDLSAKLAADSSKYAKDAKNLNLQALYRKYGPPAVVVFIVLFVLYIYSRF